MTKPAQECIINIGDLSRRAHRPRLYTAHRSGTRIFLSRVTRTMTRKALNNRHLAAIAAAIVLLSASALGQGEGLQREREFISQSGDSSWYTWAFLALVGLGGAYYFWWRSKKGKNKVDYNYKNRYANYYSAQTYDAKDAGVDADKELEW